MGDFIGTTISGMTGRGSIRHNNRSFSAANIDRSRTEQNVTYCNDDLKQVYHEIFDEALAAYNAKKKKTRDKITDYYEHIRQGKQEKLFHEAIFQIGNLGEGEHHATHASKMPALRETGQLVPRMGSENTGGIPLREMRRMLERRAG